jgi:hypothetical protein
LFNRRTHNPGAGFHSKVTEVLQLSLEKQFALCGLTPGTPQQDGRDLEWGDASVVCGRRGLRFPESGSLIQESQLRVSTNDGNSPYHVRETSPST